MTRTKQIVGLSILLILCLIFCGVGTGFAEGAVGYYVSPEVAENQADEGVGYFYLRMQPGQQQTIHVLVVNENDVDIQVAMEVNTASTNANGVIEYSATEERDASLAVDLARLVTVEDAVLTVPANDTAVASFILQMPEEPFEGELLGGIVFTKVLAEPDGVSGGMVIRNVYAYCIGLRLTESDSEAEPDFDMTGAAMTTQAGFPALELTITNPQPRIAKDIAMTVDVYPETGEEAVLSFETDVSMAPNTTMRYTKMLMDDMELPESGTYRVEAQLCYEDEYWFFEMTLMVE